jgi:hypothetical protein
MQYPHTIDILREQIFKIRYSTLLHLPPIRFHCIGGCWERAYDCSDFGIDSQTLQPLG